MTCFICKGTDIDLPVVGDFYDRDCAGCGRYLVNKTLLAEMSRNNQKFDIGRARTCIADFLKADLQAVISRVEVAKYQLIAT